MSKDVFACKYYIYGDGRECTDVVFTNNLRILKE